MVVSDLADDLIAQGVAQWRAAAKPKARQPRDAKPKKRAHPERDLQRSIVKLARQAFTQVMVAAVPNEQGGTGDADQRARFGAARKASGVVSGFPDLIVVLPGGRVMFWECKAPRGTTSDAQELVHARLYDMGHSVAVIRTLDAAADALRAALRP